MIRNNIDIEKNLLLDWKIKDCLFSDKYTKTNYFLLPLIQLNLNNNYYDFYINSFIDDEEKPCHIENSITVVFKGSPIDEKKENLAWDKLKNLLYNNKYYKYHYYVGNNGVKNLIAFVFKVDDIYDKDYKLILDGMYSKTSFNYKSVILKYYNHENKTHKILKGIFKKELWIKEEVEKKLNLDKKSKIIIDKKSEYWDSFNQLREIYRTTR